MNSIERNQHIGVFDSGFGGLTILQEIKHVLPEYSYIYLGDNARAPYGTRSFETVYKYTLEAVKKLFELDCSLIILACNTASAKALRTIQQQDLPKLAPNKRILGVIRPCSEQAGLFTQNNNLGIFATSGTVSSHSYEIEIQKFFPNITVTPHACPMWVPIVENGEALSEGADYFVQKEIHALLEKNNNIDSILLACTHYPILLPKIKKYLPSHISVINQGSIVAQSLKKYLLQHPEIESHCIHSGKIQYYTTEKAEIFNTIAECFTHSPIIAKTISL
ncbi:MAG: Glutamate racemase [Bacteroidetes bacterium ADurb.Bin217]|nr:MAG: Glutamate racemase [Bacteroidetes bacterium ADurb.Bin217]